MTQSTPNPASAAAPAESGTTCLLGSEQFPGSAPAQKNQAPSSDRAVGGGRAPRQKGDRFERAIVKLLQDRGLGAERVPLSGSVGGRYSGDLTVPVLGVDRTVECKSRKDGFRELYSWLQARGLLIVKSDRKDALVILRLPLAVEIAVAAERRRP